MNSRTLLAAATAAVCTTALAGSPATHAPVQWTFQHRVAIDGQERLADASAVRADAAQWRAWSEDFRRSMHALYGSRLGGKVVKGAPYSAEVVTENTRTLADGNVIATRTTGRVYRDGEGRTRQETLVGGETKSLTISDPVSGESWVHPPGARHALRAPRFAFSKDGKEFEVLRLGSREIRIEDGKVSVDGKAVEPGRVELKAGGKDIVIENGKVTIDGKEATPGGGRKVVVRTLGEGETGDGTRREEIRVQVVHPGEGAAKDLVVPVPPVPPLPPMTALPHAPGAPALHFESLGKLGKGATTRLGMKDIEGVKAEGTSTVWTIAAGEIGNRNPIQITSETWTSPELQVTVYSRHNDPRSGESVYRLSGIRRGEPSPELFRIPEEGEAKSRPRRPA